MSTPRKKKPSRIGDLTGVDNGTRGTYYFEAHRQTYIGA